MNTLAGLKKIAGYGGSMKQQKKRCLQKTEQILQGVLLVILAAAALLTMTQIREQEKAAERIRDIQLEKITETLFFWEVLSFGGLLLLLFLEIHQIIITVRTTKKNRILEQKAYLDVHTGLPNKSKCEELLQSCDILPKTACCMMFDLNHLKRVNDSLGHAAGDLMISNFACILRNCIPAKDFVGRFGGDEFIAILYDTDCDQVLGLLQQLEKEVLHFNGYIQNIPLSYACGYAFSREYDCCTLRTLLDRADYNMYINKNRTRKV